LCFFFKPDITIFLYTVTIIQYRIYVCQRNNRLLQRYDRDVILVRHMITDITLWRVAVALAAILVPYFGSLSSVCIIEYQLMKVPHSLLSPPKPVIFFVYVIEYH
jgi:hypothetical protein